MKAGSGTRAGATILVIEDDQSVRASLASALTRLNFRVVPANGPDEGVERFHSASPDLVIIDIHLPEANS